MLLLQNFFIFFFNDTATTEIYTLSLHDALPIFTTGPLAGDASMVIWTTTPWTLPANVDRKSTRLNSSHVAISYAVFCLKKKNDIDYSLGSCRNSIDTAICQALFKRLPPTAEAFH